MSDSVSYPTYGFGVLGPGLVGAVTGITATGNTQATAFTLYLPVSVITSVPAGSGVKLPQIRCMELAVLNRDPTHSLAVYPPKGDSIDGAAVNVAVLVSPGQAAAFFCPDVPTVASGTWRVR